MGAAAPRSVPAQQLAHLRAVRRRPDRGRHRAAQALVKRKVARSAKSISTPHRRTARWRSAMPAPGAMPMRSSEFGVAIPVMMAAARENADDDDTTVVAARSQRCRRSSKPISLCWRAAPKGNDVAVETFALADCDPRPFRAAGVGGIERAHDRQGSGAGRARAQRAGLGKQIECAARHAEQRAGAAAGERDEKGVRAINAAIDEAARRPRQGARTEINRRFPTYADLIDPKPPSVEEIKATLESGRSAAVVLFRP